MVSTIKNEWNNGGRMAIYGLALNFLVGLLLVVVGWSINATLDSIRQDIMETRASVSEEKDTRKGEICRLDVRIDRTENRLNALGGIKWKP